MRHSSFGILGPVLWFSCSCDADISLGRWNRGERPTADAETGASSSLPRDTQPSDGPLELQDAGSSVGPIDGSAGLAPVPACLEALGGGRSSVLADALYVTEASTDWSLPEPTTGFEWTLTIEKDVPAAVTQPTVGYYWHIQFSFLPGIAGRLGFQTQGVYQPDPLTNPNAKESVRMAVFWLSGPPVLAELGDIAYPEARVASQTAAGLSWQTIHAKFDWQECHTYRFRLAIESTDAEGAIWYGVWITDESSGQTTFLGRMLLPGDTGLLSPFISSRSEQIMYAASACNQLHASSAVFGAPVSLERGVASREADRFSPPFGCRRSLIEDFAGAVRHEMSVAPE